MCPCVAYSSVLTQITTIYMSMSGEAIGMLYYIIRFRRPGGNDRSHLPVWPILSDLQSNVLLSHSDFFVTET